MGAKAPERVKLQRQAACKCEVCGRKFLNVQALTSHRRKMHKTKPMPPKRVSYRKESQSKATKSPNKPANSPNTKKAEPTPPSKLRNASKTEIVHSDDKKVFLAKKTQFKCPKCEDVFTIYFTAYRHIQKYHCVDENNAKVAPNSPHLIKPIRIEQCPLCNQWMNQTEVHVCKGFDDTTTENYMCLGCKQTFHSMVLFNSHVTGVHAQETDYFFFPTTNEFSKWKTDLERRIKTKFVTLTTKQKTKQTYHCSSQPILKTDKTLLCPSSFIVTDILSGYKVTYYKQHFGHRCIDEPDVEYKRYSIIPFLDESLLQDVEGDDTIYQQFKNIMNGIMVKASEVDVGTLNTLLGKALEMTVVLNSVQKIDEVVNKTMTDDQISDVLAEVRSDVQNEVKTYAGKRKASTIKKDVKRHKPVLENDENSKVDTVISKDSTKIVKKTNEVFLKPIATKPLIQSPSFNDTYKDFVDQNFKTTPEVKTPKNKTAETSTPKNKTAETSTPKNKPAETSTPKNKTAETSTKKNTTAKKKVVMKTKIGQFKVKPSLSPNSSDVSLEISSVLPKIRSASPKIPSVSPKCITDSPKIPTVTPKIIKVAPKIIKVAPKIIKVAPKIIKVAPKTMKVAPKTIKDAPETIKVSPKIPKSVKTVDFKVKPDLKYEVKEQENDCNILILKI